MTNGTFEMVSGEVASSPTKFSPLAVSQVAQDIAESVRKGVGLASRAMQPVGRCT